MMKAGTHSNASSADQWPQAPQRRQRPRAGDRPAIAEAHGGWRSPHVVACGDRRPSRIAPSQIHSSSSVAPSSNLHPLRSYVLRREEGVCGVPPAKIHSPRKTDEEILAADRRVPGHRPANARASTAQAFEEAFAAPPARARHRRQQRHERARNHLPRDRRRRRRGHRARRTRSSPPPAAVVHAGGIVRFAECDPADVLHRRRARRAARIGPKTARRRHRAHRRHRHAAHAAAQGDLRRAGIASGRGRGARARQPLDGQTAGSFGVAGSLLVLPDEGHHQRRRRHDRHRRRTASTRSARLPRPGQGRLHANFHARARQQLAPERAARVIGRSQLARLPEFIAARRESPPSTTGLLRSARASAAAGPAGRRSPTTTSTSRCRLTASTAPSLEEDAARAVRRAVSAARSTNAVHQQPGVRPASAARCRWPKTCARVTSACRSRR